MEANVSKLSTYCLDENACKQDKDIFNIIKNEIFKNFNSFSNALEIKQISTADNVNGFVYVIIFSYGKIEASAIIKCPTRDSEDNIMHEYKVGLFLNNYTDKLPLLINTYQYFNTCPTTLQYLKEISPGTNKECQSRSAIMIESLSSSITLKKFLQQEDSSIIDNELKYILFQIYYTLVYLEDEFTHYDLHLENILLHELSDNTYINYNYILDNGTSINFKSKYLVKIIDYGRSFYNMKGDNSDIICSDFPFSRYYNKSADLILLKYIGYNSKTPENIKVIARKTSKLFEGLSHKKVTDYYKFNTDSRINTRQSYYIQKTIDLYNHSKLILPMDSSTPAEINNINDVLQNFVELITQPDEILKNNSYIGGISLKIADLTVYPKKENKDYTITFSEEFLRESDNIRRRNEVKIVNKNLNETVKREFLLEDDDISIGGKIKRSKTRKNNNKRKNPKSKKNNKKNNKKFSKISRTK